MLALHSCRDGEIIATPPAAVIRDLDAYRTGWELIDFSRFEFVFRSRPRRIGPTLREFMGEPLADREYALAMPRMKQRSSGSTPASLRAQPASRSAGTSCLRLLSSERRPRT